MRSRTTMLQLYLIQPETMWSNPTRLQRKDDDSRNCFNWENDSLLQSEMVNLLCGMPRYEYSS
jgi:hypothetical protein